MPAVPVLGMPLISRSYSVPAAGPGLVLGTDATMIENVGLVTGLASPSSQSTMIPVVVPAVTPVVAVSVVVDSDTPDGSDAEPPFNAQSIATPSISLTQLSSE